MSKGHHKEYIKHRGKTRLLRCGCNDKWDARDLGNREFPDDFLLISAGIPSICWKCSFIKWVRITEKPTE